MMNFDNNSKTDRVLAASLKCFKQYGFKRTSMADIAQAADMSRPTLYNLFKNKSDIFRSLSERFQGFTLDAVKTSLKQNISIEARFTAAILARIAPFYALAHDSAHGQELFDLTKSTAADINTKANTSFLSLIEASISAAITNGEIDAKPHGLSSVDLAHILTSGAFGLKEGAQDFSHYETLLNKMVALIFKGLSPQNSSTGS